MQKTESEGELKKRLLSQFTDNGFDEQDIRSIRFEDFELIDEAKKDLVETIYTEAGGFLEQRELEPFSFDEETLTPAFLTWFKKWFGE